LVKIVLRFRIASLCLRRATLLRLLEAIDSLNL
jgi:hypothetical protein